MKTPNKKDFKALSKNPPRIEKMDGLFVVQVYSTKSKKYMPVGEYTKEPNAKKDLKIWSTEHKDLIAMANEGILSEAKRPSLHYFRGMQDGQLVAVSGARPDRILRGKNVEYIEGYRIGYATGRGQYKMAKGMKFKGEKKPVFEYNDRNTKENKVHASDKKKGDNDSNDDLQKKDSTSKPTSDKENSRDNKENPNLKKEAVSPKELKRLFKTVKAAKTPLDRDALMIQIAAIIKKNPQLAESMDKNVKKMLDGLVKEFNKGKLKHDRRIEIMDQIDAIIDEDGLNKKAIYKKLNPPKEQFIKPRNMKPFKHAGAFREFLDNDNK